MIIKDYITFGYPHKRIINDLIRKRGFLKKEGKKMPITDNVLIEELLGNDDCICIEDIINAIHKCYENAETFKAIQAYLWPF
jgi:large subunit ribosomal protein L7e